MTEGAPWIVFKWPFNARLIFMTRRCHLWLHFSIPTSSLGSCLYTKRLVVICGMPFTNDSIYTMIFIAVTLRLHQENRSTLPASHWLLALYVQANEQQPADFNLKLNYISNYFTTFTGGSLIISFVLPVTAFIFVCIWILATGEKHHIEKWMSLY